MIVAFWLAYFLLNFGFCWSVGASKFFFLYHWWMLFWLIEIDILILRKWFFIIGGYCYVIPFLFIYIFKAFILFEAKDNEYQRPPPPPPIFFFLPIMQNEKLICLFIHYISEFTNKKWIWNVWWRCPFL